MFDELYSKIICKLSNIAKLLRAHLTSLKASDLQ